MKGSIKLINALSIIIPVAVAAMLGIRTKLPLGDWTHNLPLINAVINSTTSVLLLIALIFIKQKKIELHKMTMSTAFTLGAGFLVCYILYHISNESTKFGGEGAVRYFYYFILITHIACSLIVLPFVLRAYYYGLNRMDVQHKKVTRIAFPLWLYVSVSGVIAYAMISPYYQF